MFNNPFDSFHNTVAEAKQEREQLDRLLTISTPRERLLVVVIALLLVVLAAWLFFGSVTHSVAINGVLVQPGATAGDRSVQAIVWAESDVAPRVEAGMPAAIELGMAGEAVDALEGEVAAISAVPMSERLRGIDSAAPVSVLRVDISLGESLDHASLAGRKCRIVIELGRQSPIALLLTRRP